MRKLFPLALLLFVLACKADPGEGELTGTMSPAQAGQLETGGEKRENSGATGTFGGSAPHSAPTATTGTHPGATGTDATTLTDPNVSTTAPPPARTTT